MTTDAKRYEKAKEQATDWLRLDGYEVVNAPTPDGLWCLMARRGVTFFGVGQKVAEPAKVILSGTTKLADWQDSKINTLPAEERERFLWDLRFRLLGMDLDFSGVEFPLREITIARAIFADSFTRASLLAAGRLVGHGQLAVLWSICRSIGVPPDTSLVN